MFDPIISKDSEDEVLLFDQTESLELTVMSFTVAECWKYGEGETCFQSCRSYMLLCLSQEVSFT